MPNADFRLKTADSQSSIQNLKSAIEGFQAHATAVQGTIFDGAHPAGGAIDLC
jgi:hypothetical protein